MPDSQKNPVTIVKRAVAETVHAMKLVDVIFGTVISAAPLQIKIDQNAPLQEQHLILTRNVTDYEMDISLGGMTGYASKGGAYADAFASHAHTFSGTKKAVFRNALVSGDQVVLLRLQGGKKFLVLDRIKPISSFEGEWV